MTKENYKVCCKCGQVVIVDPKAECTGCQQLTVKQKAQAIVDIFLDVILDYTDVEVDKYEQLELKERIQEVLLT